MVAITNPVVWESFDGLVTPPDSSAAEEIQKAAPEGVRVVKAWNTTFAGTLVESGGSNPIDAGPLRRARELESLALVGIMLQ